MSTAYPNHDGHSSGLRDRFRAIAHRASEMIGSPAAFGGAIALVLAWVVSGPLFNFSDTWQLAMNTTTSIATFLVVFLLQATQNRDAKAIHLKLDELLRGVKGARTGLVHLEDLTEEELNGLQEEFQKLREHERTRIEKEVREKIAEERGAAGEGTQETGV